MVCFDHNFMFFFKKKQVFWPISDQIRSYFESFQAELGYVGKKILSVDAREFDAVRCYGFYFIKCPFHILSFSPT